MGHWEHLQNCSFYLLLSFCIEKFSALDEKTYNSINTGKIEISYDSEEECWHINSKKSSPNTLGGILNAL